MVSPYVGNTIWSIYKCSFNDYTKGAFINQKSKAGWTPLMLACLVNDINITNNEGKNINGYCKNKFSSGLFFTYTI